MAAMTAGAAAGLAGCTSVMDDETLEFTASAVRLPAEVQQETGYMHNRTYTETLTREFEQMGVTRTVEVTNSISTYAAAVTLLDRTIQAKVFATLSTPQVNVLGQSYNPIREMSAEEIGTMIQQRYEQIGELERDGETTGEMFGVTTTINRFTSSADIEEVGGSVPVYVYISDLVEVDDDFVVAFAAHPQAIGTQEETIRTLFTELERGAPP